MSTRKLHAQLGNFLGVVEDYSTPQRGGMEEYRRCQLPASRMSYVAFAPSIQSSHTYLDVRRARTHVRKKPQLLRIKNAGSLILFTNEQIRLIIKKVCRKCGEYAQTYLEYHVTAYLFSAVSVYFKQHNSFRQCYHVLYSFTPSHSSLPHYGLINSRKEHLHILSMLRQRELNLTYLKDSHYVVSCASA